MPPCPSSLLLLVLLRLFGCALLLGALRLLLLLYLVVFLLDQGYEGVAPNEERMIKAVSNFLFPYLYFSGESGRVKDFYYLLCNSIAVRDLINQSNRNCGAFLTAAL